jgi:LuxR family transcriptional regulator, maltose regulon positive regulatory protein
LSLTVTRTSDSLSGVVLRSAPAGMGLLESKLAPPRARLGSVDRPALVARLRESQATVVGVVGPAGYGKTTLLHQWAAADPRSVAWISFDRDDNDQDTFWAYLTTSIGRALEVDPAEFGSLASSGSARLSSAIPRIEPILARSGMPILILVDDLQLIRDPGCLGAVAWLAEHLPAGCTLGYASRTQPALPLARLRTRGDLLQVGIADLALSDLEAGELMRGAGVDVSASRVAEIATGTEGWPTGIYVAALAITEVRVAGAPDEPLAGDDRLVQDFLRSEVFEGLPRGRLLFLTHTSILDRMSGPLCDAILETTGSTAMLEALEADGLFVVPLDHRRAWYRYHHLFRDALRRELELRNAAAVPGLYRRAAEWYEANGQPDVAIESARVAGDPDHVARLFGRLSIASEDQLSEIERWIHWFDDDAVLERWPSVAIFGAFVHAIAGRPLEAERWARAAERLDADGPMPDGSPSRDAWLSVLRAARMLDGVEAMRADAQRALGLLPPTSPWRPRAALLAGVAHLLTGRLGAADRRLAEVVDDTNVDRVRATATTALGERAVIAIARGDWRGAEGHIERSQALISEAGLGDAPTSALTHAVAARLAIRRGDVGAARHAMGHAQRARPHLTYALPWLATQVRVELARAHLAMAESSAVRTLLGEIDEIVRRRPGLGTLGEEIAQLGRQIEELRDGTPGAWTLTTAELRLLPYLPTHLSFREIAARLCISLNTVKTQAISVYGKLGASSRSGAIERAVEVGLLDPSAVSLPGDRAGQ